jgi:NAD(P)-dependent dehydrogenase (short-subunit alcohol dehydrogenase family)
MNRAKDKVVIVTGGSEGIGRATCIRLAEQGAKVAVTDIKDKEGQEVVDLITRNGGTARYWHLNTASEKEAQKVMNLVYTTFGRIDGLVNNAGVEGVNKPTHEVTEEEWDSLMAVNMKGVFFCTKHVIPFMIKDGGGSIVNLSSIYGLISAPDVPPYHASKGGVRLMSKTDALLYAKNNIRVNSVHPGFIWTPMVERYSGKAGVSRETIGGLHPLGTVGEPDDIAYGIVYLISDESKFVTGSELVIDGGYTAR